MNTENNAKAIAAEIKKADKIALFHHTHPDGDSISCSYGLALAIKAKFPEKTVVVVANKAFLEANYGYLNFDHSIMVETIDSTYITIIGDTSAIERIDYTEEFQKGYKKLCFDHHRNTINFDADVFWWEKDWVASTMQAIKIAEALGVKFDSTIAYYLMVGLLTDSGQFAYSLADAQPPLLYAQMLTYITHEQMDHYFRASRERTFEDLKLTSWLLSKVKTHGPVNYVIVSHRAATKWGREAIKMRIHSIGNVKNFPVWVLAIAKSDSDLSHLYEVHIRSNRPAINEVATKYGGGGHLRAAGCRAQGKKQLRAVLDDLAQVAQASLKA